MEFLYNFWSLRESRLATCDCAAACGQHTTLQKTAAAQSSGDILIQEKAPKILAFRLEIHEVFSARFLEYEEMRVFQKPYIKEKTPKTIFGDPGYWRCKIPLLQF